jgi:hypothetical protein
MQTDVPQRHWAVHGNNFSPEHLSPKQTPYGNYHSAPQTLQPSCEIHMQPTAQHCVDCHLCFPYLRATPPPPLQLRLTPPQHTVTWRHAPCHSRTLPPSNCKYSIMRSDIEMKTLMLNVCSTHNNISGANKNRAKRTAREGQMAMTTVARKTSRDMPVGTLGVHGRKY